MKKLTLTVALLFCGLPALLSASDPTAQQALITAKQQASLFQDQGSPFQLDVDFVVQIRAPTQGHLTLKWEATDHWWRKVAMGDFEQIEIRNGERLYTKRNTEFTPVRIGELIGLLLFAEDSEKLVVKKRKEQSENGIELLCLRVEGEARGKNHQVCLNSASHEIMSDEWQEPPDERRREQYSSYFDFGRHRYPRKLQLLVNGSVVITANVKDMTANVFDQALFLPPKGAIERRQCKDMKHAVPVKTPDPAYPPSARENRLMGDTMVAMTVLTDGSVSDIRLIGTAAHSMDDATLQTLKGWKFKPAMCGSEPVVSDIEVTVSFRLQ
jgi:TonB family protein